MLLRLGSSSVEFNMWNPVYAVTPFILLSVSIPLAIFAVLTTSIAVSLLSFRALAVYCRLAIAIVGAWVSPSPSKPVLLRGSSLLPSSARQSPTGQLQHHRRTSTASTASSQDTALYSAHTSRLLKYKNNSLTALIGTSELTRDFEGVGGWRVPGDDDEEALWMGINSRLQLPAETPTRRHARSLTGGASPGQRWSAGSEAFRMSPVQSRARTPVRFVIDDESSYFPMQSASNSRRASVGSDHTKHHSRRKSGSGGSMSSNTSGGLTTLVKEAGT